MMTHAGRHSGRSRWVALVVAALCAILVVLSSDPGAEAAWGPRHRDGGGERGPLDILSAMQGQSRARIKMHVVTRERWSPQSLQGNPTIEAGSFSSYLCLELRQRPTSRRYCLIRRENGKMTMIGGTPSESGDVNDPRNLRGVVVRRGGRRSFSASFPYGSAGLHPGTMRWRVLSAWDRGECAPEPPPPPPPPPASKRERRSTHDGLAKREPCRDVAPNSGFYRASVIRPRIVGCTRDEDLFNSTGSTRGKRIALTYDDGPSSYTSQVLDALKRTNARATFFVVGENIPGRTSLLRRMLAEDHEIGNHSLHHEINGASYSSIHETSDRIQDATGFEPCLYRPPGGNRSSSSASAAWSQGMSSVLWDVDTNDWQGPSASTIHSRAVGPARSGSIVLMHDGGGNRSATVAATDDIVRTLKRRGYRLVTVTQLLNERFRWIP